MANETWRELTDLLALSEIATQDEVKKAYRSFAKTDHPDRNPNSDNKEKFTRVSTLIGLMNKGQLSADSQPEESIQEEDPFADIKAQKEKIKTVSNPIYEPINGRHITIKRTINAKLAEKGGKFTIPIQGTALLGSHLVRQKSIAVDIKPQSWGRTQVVLIGKGGPGLFGGKSGDLIISIKSEPLKAPIAPDPIPCPASINNKSAAAKFFAQGLKDISTPNQTRNALIVLIMSIMFINYVSNNVDTRNSDDATFQICWASESMYTTIFFDRYFNFESPYKAAIYDNYFREDIDAPDQVAEIGNQYLRIQSAKYGNIKSAGEQLSQAFFRNDNSIVRAMNQMQKACKSAGYEWKE